MAKRRGLEWGIRVGVGLWLALLSVPLSASQGLSLAPTGAVRPDREEGGAAEDDPPEASVTLEVLHEVVFYDSYAATVDEPVPEGVLRHRNNLVARRLDPAELAAIQDTLTLEVVVGALCDNYDRLGHVFLSWVPKGAETYRPEAVSRFEVARFVTPFMDMHVEPTSVSYRFDLDSLVPALQDEALLAAHDVWIELSVFGVPYAAQKEIEGCEGRIDTSTGTLRLHSDRSRERADWDVLLPLAVVEPFNNYEEGATDEVGRTRKTIPFHLPAKTSATQLVLITSNHGANEGGEEYNRRVHVVSIDGYEELLYTPGRTSCEPFRAFNTQGNGIYGPRPRTDEQWQSFSNWCPGDVIDRRVIELGGLSAGAHEFVIEVPDAVFAGGQGNIFCSLYAQARLRE